MKYASPSYTTVVSKSSMLGFLPQPPLSATILLASQRTILTKATSLLCGTTIVHALAVRVRFRIRGAFGNVNGGKNPVRDGD
jgi:hypothetical protein